RTTRPGDRRGRATRPSGGRRARRRAASVSLGQGLTNAPQLFLERRGVASLRIPRQVALPLRSAPVQIAELDENGAAIAHVHRRVGLDDEKPVDDGERLGPVLAPRIDALE